MDAQVGEVVHKVDVKVDEAEAEAHVDVDPDVHVGCDLPMSIYSQYFSSPFFK